MRRTMIPWLSGLVMLVAAATAQAGNVGPCCRCVCGFDTVCETPVADQGECDAACAGAAQQCPGLTPFFSQQDNCGLDSPPCPAVAAPAAAPALGWAGLFAALLTVGFVAHRAVRKRL